KYVMHAQVTVTQPQTEAAPVQNVKYSAPEDPSSAGSSLQKAWESTAPDEREAGGTPGEAADAPEPEANTPVVKSDWDKTPRNAPCPCGSGKKFKMCHGR
ncbi:MAG: SEC-C domain-containing protein, partial [Acidimicrobiales bacterium]